jgi:hypothetical protein
MRPLKSHGLSWDWLEQRVLSLKAETFSVFRPLSDLSDLSDSRVSSNSPQK